MSKSEFPMNNMMEKPKVKSLDNKASLPETMWEMAFGIGILLLLLVCVAAPPIPCSLYSVLQYVDIVGPPHKSSFLSPGHHLRGTCKVGYIPKEEFPITCTTVDGRPVLSPIPCRLATCEQPLDKDGALLTIDNGPEAADNITYTYGEQFTPSCKDGYRYNGPQLTCEENGKFSGDLGTCERVTCPPPYEIGPEGTSIVNATGDKFGDVVYLKQNRGYECSGLKNLTCEANGQWTDATIITCKYLHEQSLSPASDKPDINSDKLNTAFISGFRAGVGATLGTALCMAVICFIIWYFKNRYNYSNGIGKVCLLLQDIKHNTADTLLEDVTRKEEPTKEEVYETDTMSEPQSAFVSERSNVLESSNEVNHSGMLVKCDDAEQAYMT